MGPRRIILLGLIGVIVIIFCCLLSKIPKIESDLLHRVY